MKRWIHASEIVLNPDRVIEEVTRFKKLNYPDEMTIDKSLYYKELSSMCDWIINACEEADNVPVDEIRRRLEASFNADYDIGRIDEARACEDLLNFWNDLTENGYFNEKMDSHI